MSKPEHRPPERVQRLGAKALGLSPKAVQEFRLNAARRLKALDWNDPKVLEAYDKALRDAGISLPIAKVDQRKRPVLESPFKRETSEGLIDRKKTTGKFQNVAKPESAPLPEKPARLWPGRPPGRPKPTPVDTDPLIVFIRGVYGPYMDVHRNALRAYIFRHDPKLYRAIGAYELTRNLPADISMPSEQELARTRFEKAAAIGYDALFPKEKDSVRKLLWRAEKRDGKPRRRPRSKPAPT